MRKNITIFILLTFFLIVTGCKNTKKMQTPGATLIVTNECKPLDNNCELLGDGIKLNLQFKAAASYQRLLPVTLESVNDSLDEASMVLIIDDKEMPTVKMKSINDKKYWEVQLMPFAEVTKDNLKIRLTVMYKAKQHVAEFFVVY